MNDETTPDPMPKNEPTDLQAEMKDLKAELNAAHIPHDTPPPPVPESAYPPPSSPYPTQDMGQGTGANPVPPPPPPSDAYHPGSQPYSNPYALGGQPSAPYPTQNQQPNWPPPPVDAYAPVAGQAYSPVNGTMILILGILGVTLCGICAPIAWIMGNQALATLNFSGDPLNQRGMVTAGRICGIVGTALITLGIIGYVLMLAIGIIGAATSHSGGS